MFQIAVTPVSALVEKATSELLIGPDWSANIQLCDVLNTDSEAVKDVVKALKRRLGNKQPKVQLLALTVLETCMKNCGDNFHSEVARKDVLADMVKIVTKKADMEVRDKALSLLDAWQEAFGGREGRYIQFWEAYDTVKRKGIEFPNRDPSNPGPMFAPSLSYRLALGGAVGAYGDDRRFNRGPAAPAPAPAPATGEPSNLSMRATDIKTARNSQELLSDMLNQLDPKERQGIKDELILELVEQCKLWQRKAVYFVEHCGIGDERLLSEALSLNDDLQKVLARYDAITTGVAKDLGTSSRPSTAPSDGEEDDDEEDDFAKLANRRGGRSRSSSQQESRPGPSTDNASGGRLALPPPPGSNRMALPPPPHAGRRLGGREQTVDLLSGEPLYVKPPAEKADPSKGLQTSPTSLPGGADAHGGLYKLSAPAPITLQPQAAATNPFLALPAPGSAAGSPGLAGVHSPQQHQTRPFVANGSSPGAQAGNPIVGSINGIIPGQHTPPQQMPLQQQVPPSYVVPWAAPGSGALLSPTRRAMLYGNGKSPAASQTLQPQQLGHPILPQQQQLTPWTAAQGVGATGPSGHALSQVQQTLLYGAGAVPQLQQHPSFHQRRATFGGTMGMSPQQSAYPGMMGMDDQFDLLNKTRSLALLDRTGQGGAQPQGQAIGGVPMVPQQSVVQTQESKSFNDPFANLVKLSRSSSQAGKSTQSQQSGLETSGAGRAGPGLGVGLDTSKGEGSSTAGRT